MTKNEFKFLYLYFLISLINISFQKEVQEIKIESQPYSYICQNCKIKYYKLVIESEEIQNYLKIEVENSSNNNQNFIISFSNKDITCSDREQLSQGVSNAKMWLTKKQIENNNNYFCIECSSYDCSYKLTITFYEMIEMDLSIELTLYISEKNKKLEVNIISNLTSTIKDFEYITLWSIGNKKVKSNIYLDNDYVYEKYTNNNIYKIKNNLNKNIFNILMILSCDSGQILNIGSYLNGKSYTNELIFNQPGIKGFLKKGFIEEDCYNINNNLNNFYLNGIIYNKISEIYYKDENYKEIIETNNIIKNGSFIHIFSDNSEKYYKYFCIRFPIENIYDINEIFYSLYITDLSKSEKFLNLYSPKINGIIYDNFLSKDDFLIIKDLNNEDKSNEINYGIISQSDSIEIYVSKCKNYPVCDSFNDDEIKKLDNINGYTFYKDLNDEARSPINPFQNVLIIKCQDNGDSNNECIFKSIFYSNNDKINLIEKLSIIKYINKGELDNYIINNVNELNAYKINIELMIFSGDAIINFNNNLNVKKIFALNKIIYIIDINSIINDEIELSVSSLKNSFYSIKYSLNRKNDESNFIDNIQAGISYLITVDNVNNVLGDNYKIVKFSEEKNNLPLLVNFYSLNCKIEVLKPFKEKETIRYEPIESFDEYSQDINNGDNYKYIIKIREIDSANFYNNCMVYASSIELDYDDIYDKQITINNGETKEIIFTKDFKEIEYLYPHTSPENDIVININLLDIATYSISIIFSNQKSLNYIQNGNDIIYLDSYEWKELCNEKEVCLIIIKIKLATTFLEKEPALLISVNTVQENSPMYILKNKFYVDILLGNNFKYYYTDIGNLEEGEIILNFRRGCGNMFVKIVPKNLKQPENDADWRAMYKFPKKKDDSLKINEYINKIIITKKDSEICQEGCFLLLSLQNSIISDESVNLKYREHPFSILIRSSAIKSKEDSLENIPIINIPLNEYILGTINSTFDYEKESIYEYYSVFFNHDSHKIIIDFQSKFINFYIKVGNDKPTINDYDFLYKNIKRKDTIFEITKKEFLDICKAKNINLPFKNSLLGLSMTIGLSSDIKNILFSNYYSFKINLPFSEEVEIHEVNSDQKVLCKTTLTKEKKNRCLFVVFYLGIDSINQLILYPLIQDHSSYEMHANFIWQEKYENFDFSYIKSKIPTSESTYSTKKSKTDYIYIEHGEQYDMFLLVSVVTEKPTVVELLSSFYTKNVQLSPRFGSYQLFGIKTNYFLFEFPNYNDFIINIETISGQGKIYFDKEKEKGVEYYLSGNGDRISLCSENNDNNNQNLYIFKNNQESSKKNSLKFPGFIFYMNYALRNNKINFDEIPLGKTVKISYNNTDFPIYIYSLIDDLDKDINIFINLYELFENNFQFTDEIPYEIKSTLVKESLIIKYKSNLELLNKINFEFKGTYDPIINTGYVLIKKEKLTNIDINYNDKFFIIIKIEKNKNLLEIKFNKINLLASIFQYNSNIPISPNKYQYSKLSLLNNQTIYKLKTDKSNKYMRIYFSSNSNNILFQVNIRPEISKNFIFNEFNKEIINGLSFVTFDSEPEKYNFIYLIIYHNDKAKTKSEKLNNYAFKYITSESIDNFKVNNLPNSKINLKTEENGDKFDYIFSLEPILEYQNFHISYYIKFVFKSDYIKGEYNNSIAITESKSYIQYFNRDNIELKNYKIILKVAKVNEIDYRYIQIMAKIKDKNNIEFASYESIFIKEYESIFVKDSDYGKIIDIVIIMSILILLFVVCSIIYKYIKARRHLSSEIEKIPYDDLVGKEFD